MEKFVEAIKDFVGYFYFKLTLAFLKPKSVTDQAKNILLLPPSDLDGSFGDELMVKSFVANFAEDSQVTIFTDHLIIRNDFLGDHPNVAYRSGFQVRNYGTWVKQLQRTTAVFIIGADALDGSYSSRHSLRFFNLATLAHKMGIPVYFSGFSVSLKLTNPARKALQEVSMYSILKARDTDSYNRLLAFVNKEKVWQVSDMAFLCPYDKHIENSPSFQDFKKWAESQHKENRMIIAFCPNSIQANKIGGEKYLREIKSILQQFSRKTNISILYLYHDVRPLFSDQSDKDISKNLFESGIINSAYTYFPNDIENGVCLKSYLKYADITITGRMHFGISGIAAGLPMFGICYANKFEGLLKLFHIDPSNSLVDYTEMNGSEKIVDDFIQDIDNQKEKISTSLGNVNEFSRLNGKDLADAD